MAEPSEKPPRRKPPRCAMIHPYVELVVLERLKVSAAACGCAPEQLASYVLERVFGDVGLQRQLKFKRNQRWDAADGAPGPAGSLDPAAG